MIFYSIFMYSCISSSGMVPLTVDPTIEITHPIQQTQGRIVRLPQPQLLSEIVDNIKKHTELSRILISLTKPQSFLT